MKINDYIIRGGENLNSAPQKTLSFPPDAEQIFNEWHSKLGKDDKEKENYFEMPVNDQNRLFIRSFYVEKSGNRPVCFYVGLLIPRAAYIEAKDYYCLHKGLCGVPFAKIQNAALASFLPIEITIDWPIPRTTIGLDFQQLSMMKLYGDKKFNSNINQMCFSISTNSIDDWFSRLFIAINPYRLSRSFHIVISRVQPRPSMPDDKPGPLKFSDQHLRQHHDRKAEHTTPHYVPDDASTQVVKKSNKPQWVFFFALILSLLILSLIACFSYLFISRRDVSLSDYYALQAKCKNQDETIKELQTNCTNLEKDKYDKEIEIRNLKSEIGKRDKQIIELEKKISCSGGAGAYSE